MTKITKPAETTRRQMLQNFVFFRFWTRAQVSVNSWSTSLQVSFLGAAILIGVVLRLWAQTSFRNYDFDSYVIVSETLLNGENPYDTGRYNYGPNWMFFLTFARYVFEDPDAFRLILAITLTLADIGIAIILFRRGHSLASVIIMLSPISVAISGQHQQFDNIAIFLMLAAMALYRPSSENRWTRNDTYVIILISLSITTKHVFIFFLFWFALKQPGIRKALIFLFVPIIIFGLSLVPFFLDSPRAVIEHVLLYSSYNNAPLLNFFIPGLEDMDALGRRVIQAFFVFSVLATGIYLRRLPAFTLALVYMVTLVVFSSSLADQYLAIALVGAAAFLNIGFLLWMILGSIYLFGNPATLAVPGFTSVNQVSPNLFLMTSDTAYQLLSVSLFLGWILMVVQLRPKRKVGRNSANLESHDHRI